MEETVIALTIDNPCVTPSSSVVYLKKGTSLTFGRGSNSEVAIPNPYISRQHMRVSWLDDEILVHDLESTNGTRVNELRVVGSKEISYGDKICICDVTLRVKPIDDPEVGELRAQDSQLNTSLEADNDIQSKLVTQHKARKKTRIMRAGMLRSAGIGVSRAETLSFDRPDSSRRNYSMTLTFLIVAVALVWYLWQQ